MSGYAVPVTEMPERAPELDPPTDVDPEPEQSGDVGAAGESTGELTIKTPDQLGGTGGDQAGGAG